MASSITSYVANESNYTIVNNEKWRLKSSFSAKEVIVRLQDPWHQNQGAMRIIFNGDQDVSRFYLEKVFTSFSANKSQFGFQVMQRDGIFYICFCKYGLSGGGGGKLSCILGGGALALGGFTALTAGPFFALPASGLITVSFLGGGSFAAGMNGLLYGIKTDEKNIKARSCLKMMAKGGLRGSIGGLFAGGGAVIAPLVTSACTAPLMIGAQAAGGATGELALTLLEKESDQPCKEVFGKSLARGLLEGSLGYGMQLGLDSTFFRILAETAEKNPVLIETLKGGASAGLQAAATTVLINSMEGKEFTENLSEQVAISAGLGALGGGVNAELDRIKDRKLLQELRKELENAAQNDHYCAPTQDCPIDRKKDLLKQIKQLSDEDLRILIDDLLDKNDVQEIMVDPSLEEFEEAEEEDSTPQSQY